jgi:hypothetical protein
MHVSFLVVVKDPSGKPVRKATRDVPFSGPLDKLDAFQQGNFVYDDHFPLDPGRYVLETAILDRIGEKVSTLRSVFVVPPAPAGVSLSTPVLVRRIDNAPPPDVNYGKDDDRGADPLRFPGGRVMPTLDETVAAGASEPLPLYFVVTPAKGETAPAELFIELLSDGKLISRSHPELAAPGADGRIPFLANLPVGKLPAGSYEVRIVTKQGSSSAAEAIGFTIQYPDYA